MLAHPVACDRSQIPVAMSPFLSPAADLDQTTRLDLFDPLEDGVRRGNVFVPEVRGERVPIHHWAPCRMIDECLGLRAKEQHAAAPAPIEWLNAQTVAHQGEASSPIVPKREREHPDELRHCPRYAPGLARFENDFCVRAAAKPMVSPPLEFALDLRKVVHLAVIGDHRASTRRDHRLVPRRRQVDDREAALPESHTRRRRDPSAGVIRSAAFETGRHARYALFERVCPKRVWLSDKPHKATHSAPFTLPKSAKNLRFGIPHALIQCDIFLDDARNRIAL